ncbi:MAG: hypothetical protein HPY44_01270 [Armatimonadetes bacterium]|nr:hypothetical protein [Armatimonadota bacterium]
MPDIPSQPGADKLPTLDEYGRGEAGDDYDRRRRRMLVLVTVVALTGLCAFAALMVYAVRRNVNREHYEFRAFVRPGVGEDEVIAEFGEPYRRFFTRSSIEPILSGRGQYTRFDRDVSPDQPGMSDFCKVLHYRTTLEHGEFVFIGTDGKVTAVVTGSP